MCLPVAGGVGDGGMVDMVSLIGTTRANMEDAFSKGQRGRWGQQIGVTALSVPCWVPWYVSYALTHICRMRQVP